MDRDHGWRTAQADDGTLIGWRLSRRGARTATWEVVCGTCGAADRPFKDAADAARAAAGHAHNAHRAP